MLELEGSNAGSIILDPSLFRSTSGSTGLDGHIAETQVGGSRRTSEASAGHTLLISCRRKDERDHRRDGQVDVPELLALRSREDRPAVGIQMAGYQRAVHDEAEPIHRRSRYYKPRNPASTSTGFPLKIAKHDKYRNKKWADTRRKGECSDGKGDCWARLGESDLRPSGELRSGSGAGLSFVLALPHLQPSKRPSPSHFRIVLWYTPVILPPLVGWPTESWRPLATVHLSNSWLVSAEMLLALCLVLVNLFDVVIIQLVDGLHQINYFLA